MKLHRIESGETLLLLYICYSILSHFLGCFFLSWSWKTLSFCTGAHLKHPHRSTVHKQIPQYTNPVCRQILALKPIQDHQNKKLSFSNVSWSRRKPPSEDFFEGWGALWCRALLGGIAAANSKFVWASPHREAEGLSEKQTSSDFPSSEESIVWGPFHWGFGSNHANLNLCWTDMGVLSSAVFWLLPGHGNWGGVLFSKAVGRKLNTAEEYHINGPKML